MPEAFHSPPHKKEHAKGSLDGRYGRQRCPRERAGTKPSMRLVLRITIARCKRRGSSSLFPPTRAICSCREVAKNTKRGRLRALFAFAVNFFGGPEFLLNRANPAHFFQLLMAQAFAARFRSCSIPAGDRCANKLPMRNSFSRKHLRRQMGRPMQQLLPTSVNMI